MVYLEVILAIVLLAAWIFLLTKTYKRYRREVIRYMADVYYRPEPKYKVLVFLATPLFLILAPFRFLAYKREDKYKAACLEAREAEDRRQIAERQEAARKLKAAREVWLANNKPRLYYNTIDGITAVLRPDDYEKVKRQTQDARIDGHWLPDHVLKISSDTYVFITEQGKQALAKTGSKWDEYRTGYSIVPPLSRLHRLAEHYQMELVKADDIFVPWVNETLVSFQQQLCLLARNPNLDDLYYKQGPQ